MDNLGVCNNEYECMNEMTSLFKKLEFSKLFKFTF